MYVDVGKGHLLPVARRRGWPFFSFQLLFSMISCYMYQGNVRPKSKRDSEDRIQRVLDDSVFSQAETQRLDRDHSGALQDYFRSL